MYAFVDEYGTSELDTSKDGVSSHFIAAAVVIKPELLATLTQGVATVQQNFFPKGEIKSSRIGKKHKRRLAILREITKLPFTIYALVIDKSRIESEGLGHKKSFIKFFHRILFDNMYASFPDLTLTADEHGSAEFMEGFKKYVKNRIQRDLFGQSAFAFEKSHNASLLQLADLIAGTLGYIYDRKKRFPHRKEVFELLGGRISGIKEWPIVSERYEYTPPSTAGHHDIKIHSLSRVTAQQYIQENSSKKEPVVQDRVKCLYHLMHHFIYISPDQFISTRVLIQAIQGPSTRGVSVHYFRSQIVAKLRDAGIIIVSSSKGYKLATSQSDLYNFVNYSSRVVQPMMARIGKCRDMVRLSTNNAIDILDHPEYEGMRNFLDR